MKALIASNQSVRMQWEVMTWLNFHKDMDLQPTFLFEGEPTKFSMELGKNYPVFHFTKKPNIYYLPSVRAWLIEEYLKTEGDVSEPVLLTDSDVLYKEVPYPTQNQWHESADTANGYLGRKYLEQVSNSQKVDKAFQRNLVFTSIHDDVLDVVRGGSWVMNGLRLSEWENMWELEQDFYGDLIKCDSNLQVWTAEMWTWFVHLGNKNIVQNDKLRFSWGTDSEFTENAMHNAGITIREEHDNSFQKGKYNQRFPTVEELDNVTDDNLSKWYAQQVKNALYGE